MASFLILILLEFFLILFLALGYLIRFRGRVDIIAGYREGRIKDPAALSRLIGNNLLLLGILASISFLLVLVFPEHEVVFFLAFTIIVVPVIGIGSAIMSRRYLKK
jgi:hypothetical protein